jgi:glycosyltransferase involved in cell wall biosynthesis
VRQRAAVSVADEWLASVLLIAARPPTKKEAFLVNSSSEAHKIVVISPCRDEEATLERTIGCMLSQSVHPEQWVIVDDGSRDRTPEILDEVARKNPWIRIVRLEDRGFRKVGGGVVDAFYAGLATVDGPYDFVAKMDVDLEFPPRYFERILEYFDRDPKLASASGKVYRREGDRLVEEFLIDEMVAGQFKLYRREAFERIGGFVAEVMWDGIDFHRARMEGFRTASLPDPELRIIHLRLMGSSDTSVYRGRLRWGRGQWFMGSAFPYVLASAIFRMREKPYGTGGLVILAGYCLAALRREGRYDDAEFQRDLRRWQYRRLVGLLRGRGPR